MRVHLHVDACLSGGVLDVSGKREQARKQTSDGTMDDGPIFEFDRDGLIVELHEESAEGKRAGT